MEGGEQFDSVAWERPAGSSDADEGHLAFASPERPSSVSVPTNYVLRLEVREPVHELQGTKEMFVSYLVATQTDMPHFTSSTASVRRRFQDFSFLREHLVREFPACVVPPLPDKHRMEYFTGDRFSNEFVERRRVDLHKFLERLARHPKLSRTSLLKEFLESSQWNVFKHHKASQAAGGPEAPPRLMDNLSDTLMNAFAKVRKPDERFVELRTRLEQLEDGLANVERLSTKSRTRLADLSGDYEDMAIGVQGLAYLESGIFGPLTRFEHANLAFGRAVHDADGPVAGAFVEDVHSLIAYSAAFRGVLKFRDQKQLDFEETSAYLSTVSAERERLVGGYGHGLGLGSYLKDKVDSLRGGDNDGSREARLARLDERVKELQDAVIAAQETLQRINEEVIAELGIFETAKRVEMKALLRDLVDVQIKKLEHLTTVWDSTPAIPPSSPPRASAE